MKKFKWFSVLSAFVLVLLLSCAAAPVSAPSASYEAAAGYASDSVSASRSSEVSADNRMITYTASLAISVKDTDETRVKLTEQIKTLNGFIVRETENLITARIPAANMDNYINFAKTLGNVENETRTGTDITDQYQDTVLRLDGLKNVRNRYVALLEQANTVSDILSIEKELERINLEIERLEGRIQQAEHNVAYSNITVRFGERVRPGPVGWVFFGLYHGIKWLFVWN